MVVLSVTWVARSVGATQVDGMADFARALGLTSLAVSPAGAAFTAVDGGLVEFCGPQYPTPPHLFADQHTVIGFEVDDLDETVRRLDEANIELVGERGAASPVLFQHVRGPDGRIYGLIAALPDKPGA